MAIMYGKPRFATIETEKDSHFVTLEKDDYMKVIHEADERKVSEELKTLKQFSILSCLTRITLHKMYYQMQIIKYKRG